MTNTSEFSHDDQPLDRSPAFGINIQRILGRALRYWYSVVASLLVFISLAFIYNRYAQKVYTVTASIIVREGNENAAAEFLYKSNPLINPYRNYYNELYIMRSYPLLQQVVEQLNFNVAWYRDGNVKTTEVYGDEVPAAITLVSGGPLLYGKEAWFEALSPTTFSLELVSDKEQLNATQNGLPVGDTIPLQASQVVVVGREKLMQKAVGKRYRVVFRDPYQLARAYSDRLSAKWAEVGSSVINLQVNGNTPKKERDFLAKFIERYQQYDVDKKNLVASRSIEFLDNQLNRIGDSLNYFDDEIERFKRGSGFGDMGAEATRLLDQVAVLETQRAQLSLQESYLQYLENYMQSDKEFDQVVPPSALGITDEILTTLITQLTELQFSLRMLGSLQTEQNPLVIERKLKIQQLKGDILEGVKSVQATLKINREQINAQIQKAERILKGLPQAERQLVDIRRSYTVRENLYIFLMQKRAEAGISRASTTSDIIVVNPPDQIGGPISPKPMLNYLIGVVAGLLLPLLFFAVAEVFNTKVQSREEIEQLTTIPIIGGIGHNPVEKHNLAVLENPRSALAESFRTLRSNMNYFTGADQSKIILITSSISGEGKTFTTINLATVIAFSGKKVLIVGADMRRPKIFEDFKLSNDKGLSTYLSGLTGLDESIQPSEVQNLHLLSSGPVPPNPSELLMSPRLADMLKILSNRYDYILFDTPPLGLVSDVFSLAEFAHHIIFMVRQNLTPRAFMGDLQQLYQSRGMKNISILFNDIKKTGPGYGNRYGYGYGYGYGYDSNYVEKSETKKR